MWEQGIVLKYYAGLTAVGRHLVDPLAFDLDRASVRWQAPGNQVEQRGFSAARWSKQRHQLATANADGGIGECSDAGEPLADLCESHRSGLGVGRGGSPRSRRVRLMPLRWVGRRSGGCGIRNSRGYLLIVARRHAKLF